MAFAHIHFNKNTQYGAKLSTFLTRMEVALDDFADVRDLVLQMIDGDGSDISHFDEVVKRFGFSDYDVMTNNVPTDAQRTVARNAWLEMDSAYSKISGNGSVSNVNAALLQLFAKLRG